MGPIHEQPKNIAPETRPILVDSYELLSDRENVLRTELSDGRSLLVTFRNHGRETPRVVDISNENDDWIHDQETWSPISSWFDSAFVKRYVEGISNPRTKT